MKCKLFVVVIFCFLSSTIARRKHDVKPSEFSCPKVCDCDKLNYYKESTCTRNGSSLELILRQTSVFDPFDHSHIRGNHLIVNCSTEDYFPYEIISEFNFVNLVFIRYNGCPLPKSESFSQIHSGLFEFHFNTNEHISLTKENFKGLDKLQELYLKSTSSIDLADDVFADNLPFLTKLTIISNQINEKIFDQPSNVTSLTCGGFSGEFNSFKLNKWSQLTSFGLTNSKIRHLTKELFANIPQIQSIYLAFNEINSFDSDAFESLDQLISISLDKNKIVTMPNRLFIKSKQFDYFRIECDKDTSFDTLPDEFLSNLPKLRTVYILQCNLQSVPENLLKNSTNVYDLNLRNNSLTDLPANFLAGQTSLGHINLSANKFNKFSDTFFENLLTKPTWENTRFFIYFTSNEIESLSQKQISYLSQFNGYFDFRSNSITDLSGFVGLVKGHESSFVNLERNPINCECSSVQAYKQYSEISPNYYQRHINGTICANPLSLHGTAVINVNC